MKLLKLSWLLLLALPLFVISCNDDDKDEDPKSIVEIATDDDQFSDLVTALDRVGLVSTLEGNGPFTVFAPTNAAFAAANIDVETVDEGALRDILLYHVIAAKITSTDLGDGQTYAGSASATGPGETQLSLLIEKSTAGVEVNNSATVTTADVDATNGVIHIIDNVLIPLDVVGHAAANSNFSSLVGALGAASGDLVNVLNSGTYTVFAPLDNAFAAIQSTVDGLDADQLAKVLLYHVVGGNVTADQLSDGQVISTANDGISLTASIAGGEVTLTDVSGNEAKILLTNVQATNGVIHVIDTVVVPDNL